MSDRRTPSGRDVRPVRDLVTDEEAAEALVYIDTIPHDYAIAYARQDLELHRLRATESVGALYSNETANDRRLWDARSGDGYMKQAQRLFQAQVAFQEIKAKRDAAMLKVELYRTIRADKRARDVMAEREAEYAQRGRRD